MELAPSLPLCRPELVMRPLDQGRCVVKDPLGNAYFEIGEEEHFLLMQLDGEQTAEQICKAFAMRFEQPLTEEDLDDFVKLAEAQGFLQLASGVASAPREAAEHGTPAQPRSPQKKQSLLYWRKNIFDPDRLFTWLEPKIRFFWTRAFLLTSAACIVSAAFLLWTERQELVSSLANALRLETVVWTWLTLLVVTALHESAHGLTCKHYGGEVHEIGFLLLFFMPCFYCNVSDAWLFKEKSKRLWVTFAGGYFELFVWALAVFVWRLTLPGSLPHYLAFIVVAACGVQTLFNFNPLLKLDGYYLVSDWLEVPNLQQQALGNFKGHTRWLLWGGPRPPPHARGKLLWRFGLATWLYSLVFLC